MATEIGVSYASYRPWENGRDDHAGPTRLQAEQLDKALRRLLRSRYIEGEAFDVWGWPRQQDMSYDRVVELLRLAGFDVPRLQANGRPPAGVIWVHRAREANLVHGVFALAAAAATRAGAPGASAARRSFAMNDRRSHDLCDELESRIRTWVAFASGDDAKLSTRLYSEVLTEPYLTERGWSAVTDYLNPRIGVLDFLVASKVISPLQYTINAEESVQALLRNAESLGAERLLTPLRNWLVFEKQIAWILGSVAGWHGRLRHHPGRRGRADALGCVPPGLFRRPVARGCGTSISGPSPCPVTGRRGRNGRCPRGPTGPRCPPTWRTGRHPTGRTCSSGCSRPLSASRRH